MDNGLQELEYANTLIEELLTYISDQEDEICELYETIGYMQGYTDDREA